jgi:acyl-[acyl-carrier-protein]-phospholipid O-acyltransferase/long-chain-fatty-acid--[acyl-carrier-protein] ligase
LVTGAEKLPSDLATAFEERFQIPVLQGYGLTETSPVVSVNLPGASHRQFGSDSPSGNRPGSVGRLAPGMSARIRDPETHASLPFGATGMLWLKGPNIFEGYLHDPSRTAEVLQEGWLRTGDLGRCDPDGLLYIEGRLSRFSKIAGEMVPHETLEAAICKALGVAGEERVFAVAGIPDAAKGEALVLLSTRELPLAALRASLLDSGLPNLWLPRRIVRCEEIPHLASGKLDLRRIQEVALKGEEGTDVSGNVQKG